MPEPPHIGDVYVVRTAGIPAWLIRWGAALRDQPNLGNHVAIMHHFDAAGVPWGLEGKPGGVGWVDMRRYVNSRWTTSNAEQPRDPASRLVVAKNMEAMIGTKYDWQAIADDAFHALGIPALFAEDWHGQGSPGHVVCSSYAAWQYHEQGWAHPNTDHERHCAPSDWTKFNMTKGWING